MAGPDQTRVDTGDEDSCKSGRAGFALQASPWIPVKPALLLSLHYGPGPTLQRVRGQPVV